jgi:hypothetical protein
MRRRDWLSVLIILACVATMAFPRLLVVDRGRDQVSGCVSCLHPPQLQGQNVEETP